MTSISKLRFGKELSKLTAKDIQLLIDNKIDESQNLEYKRPSEDSQKDCDNIAEVLSSFLNTDGGLIVYGVAESQDKDHRYATNIICCKTKKETIENLLISRIQPWSEDIIIQRVPDEKNPVEAVYVIEVPKSNNPPHMCNNIYYQRHNFQNKPMPHESVYRAFQTSWTRRRDIIKYVIEPLYSEIKSNFENIRNYNSIVTRKFEYVTQNRRFIFDLLEMSERKKIEKLYNRLGMYQGILFQVYKYTTKLMNEELGKLKPNMHEVLTQRINEENFLINLCLKDASGNIEHAECISIRDALLKKMSLKKYLRSLYPLQEIIDIIPIINNSYNKLSIEELKDLWNCCKSNVKQNGLYLSMWKERAELLELSKKILKELAN